VTILNTSRRITGINILILLSACSSAAVSGSGSAPVTVLRSTSVVSAAPEAAVAGDIPDSQAFVAYASPDGYTIKVPEGWARTTEGAATVFTDKFNTIRVELTQLATAPTVDSVTTIDLAAVAKSAKGYTAGKVSAVTRKAGAAVLATYTQEAPPNAVTNKAIRLDVERYVFWKAGKAAVVTLSSAAGSDNVDPWKIVTDGFAWT
jgi:hypothetical protein